MPHFVLAWFSPSILGLPGLLYSLQASFASLFFFPHLYLFPHLKQRKAEEREARQRSPTQALASASGEMGLGFNPATFGCAELSRETS